MRRLAVFICLLAALTGTPLRQAEASADWARLLQHECLEAPDGGVGDDAELGIHTASVSDVGGDLLGVAPLCFLPPPGSPALSEPEGDALRIRVWWPQAPPALRHAWMQVFRF
jgi:hypothetical protein